ncbi:tr [Candidatus Magnetoovum chiemensis]|nr:tr [Candidatus Magnetoovum chiemensis]
MGEAEAIILFEELNAQKLLIDEIKGRGYARRRGFEVIGTLGLLDVAKEKGLVLNIKEKADELIRNGFWIAPQLYEEFLRKVGETK